METAIQNDQGKVMFTVRPGDLFLADGITYMFLKNGYDGIQIWDLTRNDIFWTIASGWKGLCRKL